MGVTAGMTTHKLAHANAPRKARFSSDSTPEATETELLNDTMQSARRFADADTDGDMKLDFDEFVAMQPAAMREKTPLADFKLWFDSADADGNGSLSIGEYFIWTLHSASEKHGEDALSKAFAKYDPDNSGRIDLIEFQKACDDVGFGLAAHQIFRALDPDGSGNISYRELSSATHLSGLGTDTQRMFTSLIHETDEARQAETRRVINANFSIDGAYGVTGVCRQMQQALKDSGACVVDLIKKFDVRQPVSISGSGPSHPCCPPCLLAQMPLDRNRVKLDRNRDQLDRNRVKLDRDRDKLDRVRAPQIDADRTLSIDSMEFFRAMKSHFGYTGPLDVLDRVFAFLDTDASGQIGFDELYARPLPPPLVTCRPFPPPLATCFLPSPLATPPSSQSRSLGAT